MPVSINCTTGPFSLKAQPPRSTRDFPLSRQRHHECDDTRLLPADAFDPPMSASKFIGMMNPKIRRSALYTPGANPTVLQKAARSDADVLIFDLEDAVAPGAKADARQHVIKALSDPALRGRSVVVRVNGLGTPWCEEDVRAVAGAPIAGVLFPKINTPQDAQAAQTMLNMHGVSRSVDLWCMIETPLAILNVQAIGQLAGQQGSRITTWVLGTNDLVKELRARHTPQREGLVPMLALVLLAARANGLCVLDGVHNDVKDETSFEFTCQQGRQMGFDGRTLIHPSQIAGCHLAYSPTDAEITDAREIIEAFALPENKGKGVIQLKGRMVELLHAEIAEQILRTATAIELAAGARASDSQTPA
ncbi:HpcH/HpaI aldolase/citrate lyase family protein [Ottowia sp. VDI28]|uniref:HpcH/HpaI aldolase/citrate lyase family protein n=1 Tax=Ottowia sp. VDI28 TaxID=3133968 RepID=UPI003C2BD324